MNISFYCVLIASLLPIVWVGYAKITAGFTVRDNANAPEFLSKVKGKSQRAKWAQNNSWEAFAPFAAAVIIAHLCHVEQKLIDCISILFIVMRILFGFFYIYNKPTLRTLTWTVGIGCCISLYYLSAQH